LCPGAGRKNLYSYIVELLLLSKWGKEEEWRALSYEISFLVIIVCIIAVENLKTQ